MKSIRSLFIATFLACLIWCGCSGPVAQAAPPDGFCVNPHQMICGDVPSEDHRDAVQDSYLARVVPQVLRELRTTRGEIQRDPRRFVKFIRAIEQKLTLPPTTSLHQHYVRIREALLKAIDSKAAISSADKRAMRNAILDLTFFTPSELAQLDMRYFQLNCGESGEGMAFFTDKTPVAGRTVISFCPGRGMLLGGGPAFLRAISFSLAHEMSHSIDSRCFQSLYSGLRSCFGTSSGGDLGMSLNDLQLGETTSDYWAGEAISELLKDHAPAEKTSFLKTALKPFCGSVEDFEHPAGEPRIRVGLGRHAKLNSLFGCPVNSDSRPLCGI